MKAVSSTDIQHSAFRPQHFLMYFLRRCLAYFRPDLPRIIWSLVLTLIATLVGLLQPITIKVLFDTVLGGKPATSWIDRAFLTVLPEGRGAQAIGLAALG